MAQSKKAAAATSESDFREVSVALDAIAPFKARVTRQPITPEVVLRALGRLEEH